MRNSFRLGRGVLEIGAQDFPRAPVKGLPAAPEQAVVSRVLNQRVLETIVGLRRRALHKQEVGFGKPIQRRLQRWLVELANVAQQRIGKRASKNGPDLRDLAGRAEPIKARGKRLLQGWRDGLNAPLFAT